MFILPRALSLSYCKTIIRKPILPMPVPAKFVVVVSEKNCKETGNHPFNLLFTHLHETGDTEEKIDDFAFQGNRKFASSATS